MKRKLLPIVSHEEVTEKTEKKEIDFETCPYCGGPMRLRLCRYDEGRLGTGYHRSSYDAVHYICSFCESTSPKIYLTSLIIDADKVKERLKKEYIDRDYEYEDEEEENDDE